MKVFIFGGTTEGRRLAELLSANGADVLLCVATEYGKDIVRGGLRVISGRLDRDGMAALLREDKFDYVVDATHPYADTATQNIKAACTGMQTRYLRLLRGEGDKRRAVSLGMVVGSAAEAAELLKGTAGNVLLTIGSKELEPFTAIEDYSSRLFIRIAPMADSLQKALRLGFRNANIICMQGPFDTDMNAATIKMTGASYLVTKDSGEAGGFAEKLAAAEQAGCKAIVIARPSAESGYTFDEILRIFNIGEPGLEVPFTYFPLFMDMNARKITVVGGGKFAERRIKMLLSRGADITAVSPRVTDAIYELSQGGAVRLINREYEKGDASGAFLVIAATDVRAVNRAVMEDANEAGIPVVVADSRADCDCWFPAITENGEFIAGIVSKTGDHAGLRETAREIRRALSGQGCESREP